MGISPSAHPKHSFNYSPRGPSPYWRTGGARSLLKAVGRVRCDCDPVHSDHAGSDRAVHATFKRTLPKVHAIMFGGEALYPDQRDCVQQLCPNATFRSCILGSMDAGVFAESIGADDTRLHRVLSPAVVVELMDDKGHFDVINDPGVAGDVFVTSLVRRLTPVVRYPTGDRAEWVNKRAGIFRLLGRAGNSVRMGPVSLDMHDLRDIVQQAAAAESCTITSVQAVLSRNEGRDTLTCRICIQETSVSRDSKRECGS